MEAVTDHQCDLCDATDCVVLLTIVRRNGQRVRICGKCFREMGGKKKEKAA